MVMRTTPPLRWSAARVLPTFPGYTVVHENCIFPSVALPPDETPGTYELTPGEQPVGHELASAQGARGGGHGGDVLPNGRAYERLKRGRSGARFDGF